MPRGCDKPVISVGNDELSTPGLLTTPVTNNFT